MTTTRLSQPLAAPWPPPVIDEITELIIDQAAADLGAARSIDWLGDPASELHLYASLAEQIEARLGDAIALARDVDPPLAWDDIAHLARTTITHARQLIDDFDENGD
jgi:hypothetical protein